MTSLVASVSPLRSVWGVLIGLLTGAFAVVLLIYGHILLALSLGVLGVLSCLRGLRPLGTTPGYQIALAAGTGFFGLTLLVSGDSIVPLGFVVLGTAGLLHGGYKATRKGLWEPADPV